MPAEKFFSTQTNRYTLMLRELSLSLGANLVRCSNLSTKRQDECVLGSSTKADVQRREKLPERR